MSPILVRPVREQLEHDRLIRHLQAKFKRKFDAGINPGIEQNAPVGPAGAPLYPDVVLLSLERGRRLVQRRLRTGNLGAPAGGICRQRRDLEANEEIALAYAVALCFWHLSDAGRLGGDDNQIAAWGGRELGEHFV